MANRRAHTLGTVARGAIRGATGWVGRAFRLAYARRARALRIRGGLCRSRGAHDAARVIGPIDDELRGSRWGLEGAAEHVIPRWGWGLPR